MVDDGIEMAEYVRWRLGKEKIGVVGHSWGPVLGVHMVERRPDLFSAYVGTGQFTNLEDDGRDVFEQAMAKAMRESNARAIEALEAVASLPLTDEHRMDVVRRWAVLRTSATIRCCYTYVGSLLSAGYPVTDVLSFDAIGSSLFRVVAGSRAAGRRASRFVPAAAGVAGCWSRRFGRRLYRNRSGERSSASNGPGAFASARPSV